MDAGACRQARRPVTDRPDRQLPSSCPVTARASILNPPVPTVAEPTAPAVVAAALPACAGPDIAAAGHHLRALPTRIAGCRGCSPTRMCVCTHDHRLALVTCRAMCNATGTRAEVTGAPPRHGSNTAPTLSTRWSRAVDAELDVPGNTTGLRMARAVSAALRQTSWWWGRATDPRHRARRPRRS